VLNNLIIVIIIFRCRKGVQVLVVVYVVVYVSTTTMMMSNRIGSRIGSKVGAERVLANDVRGGEPNRQAHERVQE
jgi:hypothetical protein